MQFKNLEEFGEVYEYIPMDIQIGKRVIHGIHILFPPKPGDVLLGFNRYDLHMGPLRVYDYVAARPVRENCAGSFFTKELIPLNGDSLSFDGVTTDYLFPLEPYEEPAS